jgi:putative ABC transport system permease protein
MLDKAIESYNIDEHYLNALGIKMVKGRNFSGPPDTSHSILVNEALVKHFAWTEPIGQRMKFPGDTSNNYLEVVGVFHDFNQKSLYNPIAPLILFYYPNGNVIQLKMDAPNIKTSISKVNATWKKYFPQLPLNISFWMKIIIHNMSLIRNGERYLLHSPSLPLSSLVLVCWGLLPLPRNSDKKK